MEPFANDILSRLAGKAAAVHTHSASDITSGTLDDGLLSSNVMLLDSSQDVSGVKRFDQSALIVRSTTPADTVFQSDATSNQIITFPDASGTVSLDGHEHALADIDIAGATEQNALQGLSDLVPFYDTSAAANRFCRPLDLTRAGLRKRLILYHDRAEIAAGWANNGTSGSGASIQNASNYVGAAVGQIITLLAGSTTTGRAGRLSSSVACVFGTNPWRFETTVGLDILSDGTNTYTSRFGFMDSQAGEPTDGAYFRYTHGTNGGRWECVTRSNNVETASALDSGITVDTALHNYSIDVNAAASSVVFQIDGVTVATGTANIPSGTSRATGFGYSIIKSAGGTNRNLNYTYTTVYSELSTPAT